MGAAKAGGINMIDTKLILIEGLPGSGKTTSAVQLGTTLQRHGVSCRWYLEEDDPHPIDCLNIKLKDLAQQLPPLWASFAEQTLQENVVSIVESRLWQNTLLFMFMSEYPIDEIVHVHQLVWRSLAPLSPTLIYHVQDNIELALNRLYELRSEDMIEEDIRATSQYPWLRSRHLNDMSGWVQFFEAWQPVADQLYGDWSFGKTRSRNAHDDWEQAYRQMYHFLQVV